MREADNQGGRKGVCVCERERDEGKRKREGRKEEREIAIDHDDTVLIM